MYVVPTLKGLMKEKNIQYSMALYDGLLSSLLSRFDGLMEQLEISISFQPNRQFYDLYKDSVFLFFSISWWYV